MLWGLVASKRKWNWKDELNLGRGTWTGRKRPLGDRNVGVWGMVSILAQRAAGGANGKNNSKIHFEKYSTCFPSKFPCNIRLEKEFVRLEMAELCWSEITDPTEVEVLCPLSMASGDWSGSFILNSWILYQVEPVLIDLFFSCLRSPASVYCSVPLFSFHFITQPSFCFISENSPWIWMGTQVPMLFLSLA